jgi:hypothetical protein
MMCEGAAGGLVTNIGGSACWGNVTFNCADIKNAASHQDIDIGFGTFALVVNFHQMGKQFSGGCGKCSFISLCVVQVATIPLSIVLCMVLLLVTFLKLWVVLTVMPRKRSLESVGYLGAVIGSLCRDRH